MKLSSNPKNTFAILVGIEKYDEPSWPKLIGPAMDVLRMAEWLLNQGVEPTRIKLYLNFGEVGDHLNNEREQLYEAIQKRGVSKAIEPTRAKLEESFKLKTLREHNHGKDGQLIYYFSGHGLYSNINEDRYELTADTSSGNLQAISINNMTTRLRLDFKDLYIRQWIIHDACAQALKKETITHETCTNRQETSESAEQCRTYATRPGEFTSTNKDGRGSEFTTVLLDLLKKRSLADMDIYKFHSELGEACKNNSREKRGTPDWCFYDRSSFITLHSSKTSDIAIKQLVDILNGLDINQKIIQSVLNKITNTNEFICGDFTSSINKLEDYCSIHSDLSNTDLFAIHLSDLMKQIISRKYCSQGNIDSITKAREKLIDWINTWPRKRNNPAVITEIDRLDAENQATNNIPVIVIQPFAESHSKAWRHYNGRWDEIQLYDEAYGPNPNEPLHAWLAQAILQISQQEGIGDKPIIELVLPLDKLFDPYCGLKIQLDPDISFCLGESDLTLILRLEKRWTDKTWHKPWINQWEKIQENLDCPSAICWPNQYSNNEKNHWKWLAVFKDNVKNIKKSLYQGTPFALWCTNKDVEFVEKIFTKKRYYDFYKEFQNTGNSGPNSEFIYCLVDDPDRVPPGVLTFMNQLRQPG